MSAPLTQFTITQDDTGSGGYTLRCTDCNGWAVDVPPDATAGPYLLAAAEHTHAAPVDLRGQIHDITPDADGIAEVHHTLPSEPVAAIARAADGTLRAVRALTNYGPGLCEVVTSRDAVSVTLTVADTT